MFKLEFSEVDRLQEALKNYDGDAEKAINDVFHNEAGDLAQAEIIKLMPLSGKDWKGKAPAAKKSNSLRNIHSNLAETVTTAKKYQYLYFPNDGTNTRRHIGNQQFFERGGVKVQDEIIDRCISKLTNIL